MVSALLLTSLLASTATSTSAAPPAAAIAAAPAPAPPPRNHVGLNYGLGAATGNLGVTYDRELSTRWQLQGGVGLGWSGVQLSVMPRALFPLGGGHAFFAGLGPSVALTFEGARNSPAILWANGEVGYQIDGRWQFLQIGLGATMLLQGRMGSSLCALCDPDAQPPWTAGATVPTVRIAGGVRF